MTILTNGTNREDKSVIKPKNTNGSKTLTLKSSTCILPELLPLLSSRRKYSPQLQSHSLSRITQKVELRPNPIKTMVYALKPPKQQGRSGSHSRLRTSRISRKVVSPTTKFCFCLLIPFVFYSFQTGL